MNGLHLHLMINHLPIIGIVIGLVVLAFGVLRPHTTTQRIGLAVVLCTGAAAVPVYFSGEGAEEVVESTLPDAEAFLERHEDAALIGAIASGAAALLAAATLFLARGGRPLARGLVLTTLLATLATSGLLAWVANLGGQIGHPELRSGAAVASLNEDDRGDSRGGRESDERGSDDRRREDR